MVLKYNIEISNDAIVKDIDRITNLIFKLLPSREENNEWMIPLQNLIVEIAGMKNLLNDEVILFTLLCKLESLLTLTKEEDFYLFRKVIFECLGLCNSLKTKIKDGEYN